MKKISVHKKIVLGRIVVAALTVCGITFVSLMMPARVVRHPGLSQAAAQSAQAQPQQAAEKEAPSRQAAAPAQSALSKPLTYQKGKKYVALTFDDGPSIYTKRVLRILKDHNARGTFFVVGSQVREGKDILRHAVKLGNQVASHTYRHRYLPNKSLATFKKDVRKTHLILEKYAGVDTKYVRLPYGATNKKMNKTLKKMHIRKVFWTHDTRDWSRPGAKKIARRATKNVKNGSIILMHDGGGNRQQTLKALPKIIKTLQKRGYILCTVEDLYRFGIK